jgi:uncharacterized protein YxeA
MKKFLTVIMTVLNIVIGDVFMRKRQNVCWRTFSICHCKYSYNRYSR